MNRNELKKYENCITQSNLFRLDRDTQTSEYETEVYKMVEYIYKYVMAQSNNNSDYGNYEDYALEITLTAKNCIENYSVDKGIFLHYFNAAWSREYNRAYSKNRIESEYCGIHFTSEDERGYKEYSKFVGKYAQYANSKKIDLNSEEFENTCAEALNIDIAKVREFKKIAASKAQSSITKDSDTDWDDENTDIFDVLVDSGERIDQGMLDEDTQIVFLERIESVFDDRQERQKLILSKILTSKMALIVAENETVEDRFKQLSYYSPDIYKECTDKDKQVTVREISLRMGVNEASASRTWKKFIELIREQCKE